MNLTRAAGPAAGPTFVATVQQIAEYQLNQGQDLKAEAIYKTALERVAALGEKDAVYQELLGLQGQLYSRCQRHLRAQAVLERLAALQAANPHTQPWSSRSTLLNLGSLYEQSANYTAAETLFRQIAETRYKAIPPMEALEPDPSALVFFYVRRGRSADAERLMRQALADAEQSPGPNNSLLIKRLNEWMSFLRSERRYPEAVAAGKQLMSLQEMPAATGAVDWRPSGLRYEVQQLADLYQEAGDAAQANKMMEAELSRLADATGVQTPDYRQALLNFSGFQLRQQDFAAAGKTLQQVLALAEQSGNAEDPAVEGALSQLAQVYESAGDHSRAQEARASAMAHERQRAGPDALREVNYAAQEANEALNSNQFDRAQELISGALPQVESASGPSACQALSSLSRLIMPMNGLQHTDEAGQLAERLAGIADRDACMEGPYISGRRILLDFYRAANKWPDAERLLREELEGLIAAKGSDSPGLNQTLRELAQVAQNQEKSGQAEHFWLEALSIQERASGPEHPALIQLLQQIASFYDSAGQGTRPSRCGSGPWHYRINQPSLAMPRPPGCMPRLAIAWRTEMSSHGPAPSTPRRSRFF